MILFFGDISRKVFAVQLSNELTSQDINKLIWLFGEEPQIEETQIQGYFIGPRAVMVSPWSTNAVEITQNMGIKGIKRIEVFRAVEKDTSDFDPMLYNKFEHLGQQMFTVRIQAAAIIPIEDISAYNKEEGLALNEEEIQYLYEVAERIGRPLTDSEVFGFSQVNSEHCRHKIFNGTFIIDGEEKEESLFQLIKKTSKTNPNEIVSAYKDNVAFIKGPKATQFAPEVKDRPGVYQKKPISTVLSLKAETHNFPTTVEAFNGAATGSGGEIRDRLAGGKGSLPLAGTAVYMTAYPRLSKDRNWEKKMAERPWLYQAPIDILIKASDGASDFGNKFGQPLIAGSLLTFEHEEEERKLGFDKVIMLAGGIGYGKFEQALKATPKPGDKIVVLGGDNYRIGMGGAAVSSADTGAFNTGIELNAIQRSNPEMQKRVADTIRALVESSTNPIISIHDHGAGGHLNCLSELVEETGGTINLDKLPIGDPTLSAKEIIGNESQERMGLIISQDDLGKLKTIAARERAPMYVVGEITGDHRFSFISDTTGEAPINLELADMFGSSPKTIMKDSKVQYDYTTLEYQLEEIQSYIQHVLQLEAVACKDWLTNKVDRCVGGRVAKQQCAGPIQLPLNNYGLMAIDFDSLQGIATSIGHAPVGGLINAAAGSRNSVAEALTNLIWAPLENGIQSVSLSANWMWPCRNSGEDARLYEAVEGLSSFVIDLGINVPTGKDSLSMKQKYPDGDVLAPGTVIVSTVAQCPDIRKGIEPVLQKNEGPIYYINMSGDLHKLGGSSFAQTHNKIGNQVPDVKDAKQFALIFDTIQQLIKAEQIQAGHDISAGGMLTTLLEMCFADQQLGAHIDLSVIPEQDLVKLLFAENAGIIFQAIDNQIEQIFGEHKIEFFKIGYATTNEVLNIKHADKTYSFDIPTLRDVWFKSSYLLDIKQSGAQKAKERFDNYKKQLLHYQFPNHFTGKRPILDSDQPKPKAAVLREKGSNSERELANALYLAGFEVVDVHMTDLVNGRETLEDIQFLGAVGGFSNSDVLGSAKGWAGAFKYNEKAQAVLTRFFEREDVLSIGICNGCQLFMELDVINPTHEQKGRMLFNDTHKHESAFTSVVIPENNAIMLSSLAGSRLGIWISHGEGKFDLPLSEDSYNIVAKYGYDQYPSNPNGSQYNTAMMASADGRHLVSMPHLERSIFQWNWANYPKGRKDDVSPWIEAFVNAREWIQRK